MSECKNTNPIKSLAMAIGCVGLAYIGFEYDSGWAFFGSILCFLSI